MKAIRLRRVIPACYGVELERLIDAALDKARECPDFGLADDDGQISVTIVYHPAAKQARAA